MPNPIGFAATRIGAATLAFAVIATWRAASHAESPAPVEITWKKVVLDREFRSEGVTVADVNRDGKPDVVAGNYWYEAPNWTPHEISPPQKFDGEHGYSNSFLNFTQDVNADGWPDVIRIGFPGDKALWLENPGKRGGHWQEHVIWRSACNESPAFVDLLGNRKPVLVFPYDESTMAWYAPGKDPRAEFTAYDISVSRAPGTQRFSHGLGVGDLNGDGRADVLCKDGCWEAPRDRRKGPWKFIPARLGPDCAQMLVYDVNADGVPDVITTSAHNIGVWWWEQKAGPTGPEFIQHTIDTSFSQSHSAVLADINGDGVMDVVTGKRFWAHGPKGDVNPGDPAVIYWFELRRKSGQVEWIRHQVDDDSGVGTQFLAADVNRDGLPDIITSNKKGVFVFLQQRAKTRSR